MIVSHPFRSATLIATLCLLAAAPPLAAQRDDAVATARTMKAANTPAALTARELRTRFTQGAVDVSRTLGAAGYSVVESAQAIATEFRLGGAATYYALRGADHATAPTLDALREVGMRVRLDCIEPRGTPVPCGPFGGHIEQPAATQVEWTPHSPAFSDSVLTITGSGIPPVDVRIGATVLAPISSSPSQVRVRLPPGTLSGPLSLRRQSDGVIGVLTDSYAVSPAPQPDWSLYWQAAASAAGEDARHWLSGARIDSTRCSVGGMLALGVPGVLSSTTGFQGKVEQALLAVGAPPAVAHGWDTAFRAAWQEWSQATTIPSLPWYPALVAVPASVAAPVPNVPTPLATLVSSGVTALSPPLLTYRVRQAIGAGTAGPAADAAGVFAQNVALRFAAFLASALVANVMGGGPVPDYAPPRVVAAAVKGGVCSGQNVLPTWSSF